MSRQRKSRELPVIGWREWVGLPDLGVDKIKVKVDTGARTSALHAFDIEVVMRDGVEYVHFNIHPAQHAGSGVVAANAPLHAWRWVRSSSGSRSHRPVIRTQLEWAGHSWPVELTLTNRDEMGFRMLLGRQAIRNRAVVDAGRSFLDRQSARNAATDPNNEPPATSEGDSPRKDGS